MIKKNHKLSVEDQCKALNVHRSVYYYKPHKKDDSELKEKIMGIYKKYPIYGYRRIGACLKREGQNINNKKVLRIMKETGLKAIFPGPVTTRARKGDRIYPNLLKDIKIIRPYQAYQTDITYIRTFYGFMYLVALIDSFSRYILSWRLSNSLSTESCLEALTDALTFFPLPDITHSDQGCQYTSHAWIDLLILHKVKISMSGQGNSNENGKVERLWRTLKYEYLYLMGSKDPSNLKKIIAEFVRWYNHERPHQALDYKTPAEILNLDKDGFFNFTKKRE